MQSSKRAAQYLRMSTEHQRYSLQHQTLAIAAYAAARGYEIARTYSDSGISGLRYANRPGLRALMADVLSGEADFDLILTYDVSRWGRFQDPDQSAHYEFLCREAGIDVIYCAEPFENDGSFANAIVKQLKRAMAAEYSRELSVKVSIAQWNLAGQGFWMGGPPGFALRRRVVRADGTYGKVLEFGEHKATTAEKVVLVAGPRRERQVVARIFQMFVVGGMSRSEVSRALNRARIPAEDGGPWSPSRVHQVLTNRKYLAEPMFGRSTGAIPRRGVRPPSAWLPMPARYRPLVRRQVFEDAQRAIQRRCRKMNDADMIAGLRRLLETEGRLTSDLIKDAEDLPCPALYQKRFGSLLAAYALAGYAPDHKAIRCGGVIRRSQPCNRRNLPIPPAPDEMLARLAALLERTGYLSIAVIREAPEIPSHHVYARVFGSIREVYARVGYRPTDKQLRVMAWWDRRGGTGIPQLGEPGAPLVGRTLDGPSLGGRRARRTADTPAAPPSGPTRAG